MSGKSHISRGISVKLGKILNCPKNCFHDNRKNVFHFSRNLKLVQGSIVIEFYLESKPQKE